MNNHHVQVYSPVTNMSEAKSILAPLLDLPTFSRDEIYFMKEEKNLKAGRYKKRVFATFEVADLSQMKVPSQNCVAFLNNSKFDQILLYQHQTNFCCFDIFISVKNYSQYQQFDKAVRDVIIKMQSKPVQLVNIKLLPSGGNGITPTTIKQSMMIKSGFNMIHQLINVHGQQSSSPQSTTGSMQYQNESSATRGDSFDSDLADSTYRPQEQQQLATRIPGNQLSNAIPQGVLLNESGTVFDVNEFARGCIKVLENLVLFTNNAFIRQLRFGSGDAEQERVLRLLDHRPILHQLWLDTIQFALSMPKCQHLRQYFTQEQISFLFNNNKQAIENGFNQYVIGPNKVIVHPHPVRSLLNYTTLLMACKCFNMSKYNSMYTLNWMHTSYYVSKNFLQEDLYLSSNEGNICFSGYPGSGKSFIQGLLYKYFNGFTYVDSGKGGTDFQNADIVSKSFIRSEEVLLINLTRSYWKTLTDSRLSTKWRVKNNPDVEVTKYCPLVITTNDNVHVHFLSKTSDQKYIAVARRWAFVRYFDSWVAAHRDIHIPGTPQVKHEFIAQYQYATVESDLMNALIACSLLHKDHKLVAPDYIIPYYGHCIKQFAFTLFGQVYLNDIPKVDDIISQLRQSSGKDQDFMYNKLMKKLSKQLEDIQQEYIAQMITSIYDINAAAVTHSQLDTISGIIYDQSKPWYYRVLLLTYEQAFEQLLFMNADRALNRGVDYMISNAASTQLFRGIKDHLTLDRMMCREYIDQTDLNNDDDDYMQPPMMVDMDNYDMRDDIAKMHQDQSVHYRKSQGSVSDFSVTDFFITNRSNEQV